MPGHVHWIGNFCGLLADSARVYYCHHIPEILGYPIQFRSSLTVLPDLLRLCDVWWREIATAAWGQVSHTTSHSIGHITQLVLRHLCVGTVPGGEETGCFVPVRPNCVHLCYGLHQLLETSDQRQSRSYTKERWCGWFAWWCVKQSSQTDPGLGSVSPPWSRFRGKGIKKRWCW